MTRRLLAALLSAPLALLLLPAAAAAELPREAPVSPTVTVPETVPLELPVFVMFAEPPPPQKTSVNALTEILQHRQEEAAARQGPRELRVVDPSEVAAYANGQIPREVLCEVSFAPGHYLQCDAAADLAALNEAYRAEWGVDLSVTDSYRTLEGQELCVETKGSMCATVGTSNHGWAAAVDLGGGIETFDGAQHAWMVEHAGEFGWYLPRWAQADGSKPEAWHWQHRPLIDALVAAGLVKPGA